MPVRIPPRCHVVNRAWDEQDRWFVDTHITEHELQLCFPYVDRVYKGRDKKTRIETDAYNRVRRSLDTDEWRNYRRQFVIYQVREQLIKEYGEEWVKDHPIVFEDLAFVFYRYSANDRGVPQFSERAVAS